MRRSGRPITRIGLTFFGVLVLGALLVGPQTRVGYAQLSEPVRYATITQPIGVGAGVDKLEFALLVSHPRCGNPREVRKIATNGVVSLFATLPARPECSRGGQGFEDYLAISPGLAGFERDSVYVMQGQPVSEGPPTILKILKIPPTGGTDPNKSGDITVFATIPAPCAASRSGIIFDRYGGFQFQLLAMCANGPIWRVNANGASTFVADVATAANITIPIEGPDVALPSFLPFARCLLGAAENDTTQIGADASPGTVFAVCPGGKGSKVSVVAKWPNAESVRFAPPLVWDCVPSTETRRGTGAYFTALEDTGIWKFPTSAFIRNGQKLNGQAFVLSGQPSEGERDGIALFRSVTDSNGVSRIEVSTFHGSFGGGRFHGSAFCAGKRLPQGTVRHSPRRIDPNSKRTFTVTILSTEGLLDVRNIDQSSVHAGFIGFEAPRIRCDLNKAGNALTCTFNIQQGGFPKITPREKDDHEAQGDEREDERDNERELKSIRHVMVTGLSDDPSAFCGGD